MNIQIITSSYPATPHDPSGTAGLFVREFALELARRGHRVVIQPAKRQRDYDPDPGLTIEPTPWKGGDQELASLNLKNPLNWLTIGHFLVQGIRTTSRINKQYEIDRTLCMWIVPSGIFGSIQRITRGARFDVWALGSDVWKIRRIPLIGKPLLKAIIRRADRVFADGLGLCRDVESISGRSCAFLPSSRRLPPGDGTPRAGGQARATLLFVGRYHANKGPDLLIEAIRLLPDTVRDSIRGEMYGLGPLQARLESLIKEYRLEDVIALGGPIQAREFSHALGYSSYLLIPSRIESIAVVFSDALQTGTPVVTMPVGDLRQIVTETGCGIVAERTGAAEFSRAITAALRVDSGYFSEGVSKAAGKFDIGAAVRRWLDLSVTSDEVDEHGARSSGSPGEKEEDLTTEGVRL